MRKNPKQIVSTLRAAAPPANTAYLGLHPLLCTLLGTTSARAAATALVSAPLHVGTALCDTIEACIKLPEYPHDKTVWQFNDPNVELFVLRQAFDGRTSQTERVSALNDVIASIETHTQLYPYLEISFVENALEFHCEDWQAPSLDAHGESDDDEHIEVPERANPAAPPSAFWIPTLAAGSLLIASIVAKDK